MPNKLPATTVLAWDSNPWLTRYGNFTNPLKFKSSFHLHIFLLQGLETGSRKVACHAVHQENTVFVFKSSYEPDSPENVVMGAHLVKHGDGVKDVAFTVEDLDGIVATAVEKGVSASFLQPILKRLDFQIKCLNPSQHFA